MSDTTKFDEVLAAVNQIHAIYVTYADRCGLDKNAQLNESDAWLAVASTGVDAAAAEEACNKWKANRLVKKTVSNGTAYILTYAPLLKSFSA